MKNKSFGAALPRAAFTAGLLLYFTHFTRPSLGAHFNSDDPINLHYYWLSSWGELLKNLALFFTTYYRPMGGLYYSVLYQAFGLNPLPHHIVSLALILLNAWMAYRLCSLVTRSELAGGLTALVLCYHAGLAFLYFLPSFVYDVLCFTFYVGTLLYYVSTRTSGRRFNTGRCAVLLLLCICALESKEMAATLPIALILYEGICRPGPFRTALVPLLSASGVTAVWAIGKAAGAESLLAIASYQPVVTWPRYVEATTRFANTILYQDALQPWQVMLLAIILLLVALVLRRRDFVFLWSLMWITPLPITFLTGRGLAMLYVPLFSWAALLAGLIVVAIDAVGRRLPQPARPLVTGLLVVVVAVLWWTKTEQENRYIGPAMLSVGDHTWKTIEQTCAVRDIRPGSRVYLTADPMDGWNPQYIFELCLRDHSIHVWPGNMQPLSPAEVEKMDYVFALEGDSLRRVR